MRPAGGADRQPSERPGFIGGALLAPSLFPAGNNSGASPLWRPWETLPRIIDRRCLPSATLAPPDPPLLAVRLNQSGGTMRLAMSLKTILLAIAVVAVSFFVSLKAMDWLAPRGPTSPAGLRQ